MSSYGKSYPRYNAFSDITIDILSFFRGFTVRVRARPDRTPLIIVVSGQAPTTTFSNVVLRRLGWHSFAHFVMTIKVSEYIFHIFSLPQQHLLEKEQLPNPGKFCSFLFIICRICDTHQHSCRYFTYIPSINKNA